MSSPPPTQKNAPAPATLSVESERYGCLADGTEIKIFRLANARGIRISLLEWAATLASVEAPDRQGRIADITLGCDSLPEWLANLSHFGSTIGRCGNRIAGGRFCLDDQWYNLATNNAPAGVPCHLHGGALGIHHRKWAGRIVRKSDAVGVEFFYDSPDGEEGYPGRLTVTVTYWLNNQNELAIDFTARTTRATIVNLINHVYWNLSGDFAQAVEDHRIHLAAESFLPVNAGLIPTGEFAPVAGTPFDFRSAKPIGRDLRADNTQLHYGGGYDHCFVLSPETGTRFAARVDDPQSGRCLELWTDQPGVQFYTANHFTGIEPGKGGIVPLRHTGFCLETGNFPNAVNREYFPNPVLRPGQGYRHRMVFRFSAHHS